MAVGRPALPTRSRRWFSAERHSTGRELRELRCHFGRQLYRVLYRRSRNLFVLLHIFRKSGSAVPDADKRIAQSRWDDFERRMNAPRRKRPRAAGHDAPSSLDLSLSQNRTS